MLMLVLTLVLFALPASAKDARAWQTAKIVTAEQPKMVVPGGWNPKVTHYYTIETKSERIQATEMVPVVSRKTGPTIGPQVSPVLSFQVGQEVKIAFEEPAKSKTRSTGKPDLYVLDSKRKEHILTIEERTPKETAGQ